MFSGDGDWNWAFFRCCAKISNVCKSNQTSYMLSSSVGGAGQMGFGYTAMQLNCFCIYCCELV